MSPLRTFIGDHGRFSALLLALALTMKVLLPAGYMLEAQSRVLTVLVCTDASDANRTKHVAIQINESSGRKTAKADGECPYSALSLASLGGADPILLGLAFGFILALAFTASKVPRIGAARYMRPPLRGPPLMACP